MHNWAKKVTKCLYFEQKKNEIWNFSQNFIFFVQNTYILSLFLLNYACKSLIFCLSVCISRTRGSMQNPRLVSHYARSKNHFDMFHKFWRCPHELRRNFSFFFLHRNLLPWQRAGIQNRAQVAVFACFWLFFCAAPKMMWDLFKQLGNLLGISWGSVLWQGEILGKVILSFFSNLHFFAHSINFFEKTRNYQFSCKSLPSSVFKLNFSQKYPHKSWMEISHILNYPKRE